MKTFLALGLVVACSSSPAPPPVAQPPQAQVAVQAPNAYEVAKARALELTGKANGNLLLAPWTGPYDGTPPLDKLDASKFGAAFELGLQLLLAEVDVIAENPSAPTFENTLVALEDAGRHQQRAENLFGIMTSNLSSPEVQAVDKEWSPKMAAAYDAITFNAKLFARVAQVYANRAQLDAEKQRVVTLRFERMVRAGSKLTPDQKTKVGEINQQLAVLYTDFSNKLLADENTWTVLEKPGELAGLSEQLKATYKAAADERGLAGKWLVVNTRSSVDPFLIASSQRALRERVWKAFKSRGDNGNENDTNATIAQILRLRAERAKLLGFQSHADYRMADTMAKLPLRARGLMLQVWPAAVARVGEEVADMTKLAKRDGLKLPFEPWDYLYYAEKVRKQKYDLDAQELRQYFELESMIKASFFMAEKLYGLSFQEITGKTPVFLDGVRVWEVRSKAGATIGLFYGDYFARKGKRSGAWATGYRDREAMDGVVTKPIVSNNNNIAKGGPGEPVLISLDDAETLFHEFGHALHALLSEVKYPSLGNTPRDFVEYPSQVHEMWVLTRPVLDQFARHYKTGKPMPKTLVAKIDASRKFNTGYSTVEYLSSAILDLDLHSQPDLGNITPSAFEKDRLAKIGAPREVAMRHRLPQFSHLFTSDSYSAGYYSYLWSDVMAADTRKAFEEAKDVFDPAVAEGLRKYILAPGNTTDRAEAYRQFRGRDPDINTLLEKRGFPTK